MQENIYTLIKEFKYRDLDGVDHFRYFVEENGNWLSHTNCDSLEEAEKWYNSLVNPSEQVPDKITILKSTIVQKYSGNHVDFDNMTFSEFYNYLNKNDLGYWDNVNSEDIVRMYIDDMKNKDVNVLHIEEVLENNPSRQKLYKIWLGNSMQTPTPINTKEELLEALDLDRKDYFAKGGSMGRDYVDFDDRLSKLIGFDVKKLDDLDIKPKD